MDMPTFQLFEKEGGGKGEGTVMPVDAWVVPCQPREAEDELEMAKASHLKGEVLGVGAMDTQAGREGVGDRTMRGSAAINKL